MSHNEKDLGMNIGVLRVELQAELQQIQQAEREYGEIYKEFVLGGTDPDEAYLEHFAKIHGITNERAKAIERLKVGESNLAELVRMAFDRTEGKPTQNDTAAANEICKQYEIPTERAQQILQEAWQKWWNGHRSELETTPANQNDVVEDPTEPRPRDASTAKTILEKYLRKPRLS